MIATLLGRSLLVFASITFFARIAAAEGGVAAPSHQYPSSWSTVSKLAFDIHAALKAERREHIHIQPVSVDTDVKPTVKLEEYPDEKKPLPMIFISIGFVDLLNNLAHAKAISTKDKKYYQKYIDTLAGENGEMQLAPLPGVENDAYWTDDMMNEYLSNFNSIAGILVSINFAHHYLGQYRKYEKQIMDENGNSIPINQKLTPEEYEAAFAAGVRGAMEAGIMVEGLSSFFEAFDKMKTRPAWSVYFMPEQVKFSKLKKTLVKLQTDFLNGKSSE